MTEPPHRDDDTVPGLAEQLQEWRRQAQDQGARHGSSSTGVQVHNSGNEGAERREGRDRVCDFFITPESSPRGISHRSNHAPVLHWAGRDRVLDITPENSPRGVPLM
eukprot:TRINITY_DN7957_c0_g1_i5.p1 TRINITY_DN7957_c0_g1~~TRINITY_DN7957_c0_g1_i5.p1  ORF type:complete len:124 (+),score=10.66 TRINITY_DN7957_c0_g1_i5:54-374(+)